MKVQPQKVELVEGYWVYLTQHQLDEVVDSSGDVSTFLMRNLLATFTPDILSKSSALGKGKHPALESDILGACISKFTLVIPYHIYILCGSFFINRICAV